MTKTINGQHAKGKRPIRFYKRSNTKTDKVQWQPAGFKHFICTNWINYTLAKLQNDTMNRFFLTMLYSERDLSHYSEIGGPNENKICVRERKTEMERHIERKIESAMDGESKHELQFRGTCDDSHAKNKTASKHQTKNGKMAGKLKFRAIIELKLFV